MGARNPSIDDVRAGLREALLSYKASGLVDNVRILAGCCPVCDADEGVAPLNQELANQRLPHPSCENAEGGPCPCAYSAEILP
jgi:hypothetical protein